MTIKNGDLPASPICYDARIMATYSKGEAMGLTKREYFAALAMQSIIACDSSVFSHVAAEWAVNYANALLAELERTK